MGDQQYLRRCKLTVEGAGKAIGFEPSANDSSDRQLRIRFDVHQRDSSTPHHANIYITNLSRQTAQAIRKEYKSVTLEAGYEGSSGVIFKGEIVQVRILRESVTDGIVHILATSAQRARNFATVNKALASGHTFRDRVDVAAKALKEFGVEIGHIDDLGSKKFPRGFACFGNAKDLLREVCFATGSSWHITNGKLNVVKNGSTLPGSTIVLNSNTGMIGFPEQTLDGVVVRCLLNYRILPTQKLQINESSIQQAAFSPSYLGELNNQQLQGVLGLAADGIYKALLVEHNGDLRGPNWYTEIVCVKADGGASLSLYSRGITED